MKLFRIHAGTTTKNGRHVDAAVVQRVIAETLTDLAASLGGGTCTSGTGSYKHEDGRVVLESSLTFEVYAADSDVTENFINRAAVRLRNVLQQESVLVVSTSVQMRGV